MAHVLVLEPDPEIRTLFEHLISQLGHKPIVRATGDGTAPDVVLLEPSSRRGLAEVESLREQNPALPIVCASIYPRSAQTDELGPVAFLEKPFALSELERALRIALTNAS